MVDYHPSGRKHTHWHTQSLGSGSCLMRWKGHADVRHRYQRQSLLPDRSESRDGNPVQEIDDLMIGVPVGWLDVGASPPDGGKGRVITVV